MTAGYPGDSGLDPDRRPDRDRFFADLNDPRRVTLLPPTPPLVVAVSWRGAFRIGVMVWLALLAFAAVAVLASTLAVALLAQQADDAAGCDPTNSAGEQVYCP